MRLYDFEGKLVANPPKIIYRGFDTIKDETDTITQLNKFFSKEFIPSKACLIKKGNYDFDRGYHNAGAGINPDEFKDIAEIYIKMLSEKHLNPEDINKDLIHQHEMYFPTPFVSTSTKVSVAARYSRWIKKPILAFSTDNLEGIDFRRSYISNDNEIAIFKKIPIDNLINIIYFYENTIYLKKILSVYGKEDIILKKGYTRPDFQYKTFSGDLAFRVPDFLDQHDENFGKFYKELETKLLSEYQTSL
ncbi:MAG: hypothetical protein KAT28_01190 [Candidatus Aenigmarchaeota archaeon]|nr:hypothetical protein [Candidatus Aenigmarchaeota archaeon]